MLTSQAFKDYFPSSLSPFSLKVAGALLKDSPCSFSLGGYATAQNCPELLAQPPTVGSFLKKCRMAPFPLDTQTAPCNTWHRSFHPDVSYSEFCPADVPPLRISHIRRSPVAEWERRTIQLPRADMSGSFGNAYPECALDLSAIPTLSSWGLNHQTSRLSLISA